ncbi:hypothetical protein HD806DRAFT_490108 [Xylariaceae sp. AK1471]|nr:hypothetical protein HD806DRAFT_490108 [Xylariaceae sp. AK1471]
MAYGSSSEDEFPDVEVIIQRHKQKTTADKVLHGDKESAPAGPSSPRSTQTSFNESIGKTPSTARRRRKLGQGQPVGGSLTKPWRGLEVENGTGNQPPSSRQTSWTRAGAAEASTASAGELLDRFPVKVTRDESRVVSRGTKFDSPAEERKRTRRLISRGEKKALDLKVTEKEKDWLASSDESESDSKDYDNNDPMPSQDEDSEFTIAGNSDIEKWDSDSDNQSTTLPRRSQSPSGPRRMQRRVLSSSNDPSKKQPARSKPIQDNPVTSPKKRPEKQKVPKESTLRKSKVAPKGNLEDVFEKLKIFNEESELDDTAARDKKTPVLEPSTPRKTLTASPTKVPIIPMSPWKPEHKEFWDPEVNFAWIDKHSPPKKKTTDLTGPEGREELKRRYGTSPEKKQAKKAFDTVKEDLARTFLLELDEVITKGKLAQLTETTGGLRIQWSNTLLTTAGRAHWKCKTTTTTSKQPLSSAASSSSTITKTTTTTQHYASIELATKVLSNESDLLNTVAHEFCHLAVFLLHGKPKLAHGAEFKTYGGRVMGAALKTPRSRSVDINVTTRHSYEIEYRYVWQCADCGTEVRRHSRSVDTTRQRCGKCKGGVLVQVKPVPRGSGSSSASKATGKGKGEGELESREAGTGTGGTRVVQKVEKKKSAYQEFTSREMKALSVSHKGISFKEKMVLVSARWSEHQKLQKSKTPETGGGAATDVTVRNLAGAVEVLKIVDDDTPSGRVTGADGKKKAVYDIFA